MIGGEQKHIAERFNRARNGFLHWRPGRRELPKYNGETVVSKQGMRQWMADAVKFFEQAEEI